MVIYIIIALASIFGLVWTYKTRILLPSIITLGMIFAAFLITYPGKVVQVPGFYIYLSFVALAFIYGITAKGKKPLTRIIISLMTISVISYWLWVLNHWHGNVVLFPVITLLALGLAIVSKAKLKNELGFIVFLAADAVAVLIEQWMKSH